MERVIKFRGKDIYNRQWFYGYVDGDYGWPCCYIRFENSTTGRIDVKKVFRKTVGQYTGLCDRNGREIYEGDIVKTKGGWGGVVTWNSRGYFYVNDNTDLDEEPDVTPIGCLQCYKNGALQVVGNIHK